ncbi:MAG: ribokinase [Salinicola sp.]|uniref:ribokinase n=1 Tax=uncultured Salinicola sp. TaxID=1193542 RepID=UPI000C92C1F8|nr:ribokinase [uncultured Salinicola sp.]MAM59759.1 ribokinase [Salinicola sp.]
MANDTPRIYNYGSINIDHVYRVPHLVRPGETLSSTSLHRVLGGKGANQSLALARAGGCVVHWGRLNEGDRWALAPLSRAGVDVADIELTDDASGHALIQVDDAAENAIILYPGANHGFDDGRLGSLVDSAAPGSWILLQNECNDAGKMLRLAAGKGLSVAFNPAPLSVEIADLPLDLCQLLFLNRGEAAALVGQEESVDSDTLLEALATRLPEVEVVLTLGGQGACHQHRGERVMLAAHKVEAIDTTAAGDTFIGYFMAARQRGDDVEQALRLATTASALCVQKAGAEPSIPDADAAEKAVATLPALPVERSTL